MDGRTDKRPGEDYHFLSSCQSQKEFSSVLFFNVARIIWAEFLLKNAADLNRLVYQGRDTLEPHLSEVEVPETLQLRNCQAQVPIPLSNAKPQVQKRGKSLVYDPDLIPGPDVHGEPRLWVI